MARKSFKAAARVCKSKRKGAMKAAAKRFWDCVKRVRKGKKR